MAWEWVEPLFHDREVEASALELRLADELLAVGDGWKELLEALTDQVLEGPETRGNLLSLVDRLWQAAEGDAAVAAGRVVELLEARRRELARGGVDAAGPLNEALGSRDTVLTLSRSSAVVGSLAQLDRRLRSLRVVVGEGRPLREGLTASRELAARGVRVSLVTDAVLAGLPLLAPDLPAPLAFVPGRAAVVLGAVAISGRGTLAKSGALALAAAAERVGMPVIVVADPGKLLPPVFDCSNPREADPVDLGAPAAVGPVNLPCEWLDWSWTRAVVLGSELLAPEEVAARARELRWSRELGRRLGVPGEGPTRELTTARHDHDLT